MYEICVATDAFRLSADTVRSFHNASAGDEVCATSHYFATESARHRAGFSPVLLDWYASAQPFQTQRGAAAARIESLVASNRDRWVMDLAALKWPGQGAPTTGSLTSPSSVRALASRVGKVHFYTACGIDAWEWPLDARAMSLAKREADGLRVLVGAAACGLMCLAGGGTLVLRVAQWALLPTRMLLAMLAERFDSCMIARPSGMPRHSLGGYFVATGFRGAGDDAELLLGALGAASLPGGSTGAFIEQHGHRPSEGFQARLDSAAAALERGVIAELTELARGKKCSADERADCRGQWLSENPITKLSAHARIACG